MIRLFFVFTFLKIWHHDGLRCGVHTADLKLLDLLKHKDQGHWESFWWS